MDTKQKLARIEAYLGSDPGNKNLLASAIDLYLSLGQTEDARRHADAALAIDPADHFFLHRYGNVLIAQGLLGEAQYVFEKLHKELNDAAIAYNLAYVYFRLGKFSDAGRILSPQVALPDATPHSVTLCIRSLHHLGEVKRALEVAERHAGRCAADADFLSAASLLYLDDGQLEKAQQLSTAAQRRGEHPLEALVVGGTIALGRGDVEAANSQFAEALKVNPADGRTWSGLGLASLLNRDVNSAENQLAQAVAYLPTHIGTRHILGWCKIINQDLAAAETVFHDALALDRNFGESHGGLAVVEALQGKKHAAGESIKRALGLDPNSLSARYAQTIVSTGLKDPAKFRAAVQRILVSRQGPFGGSLAELVTQFARK